MRAAQSGRAGAQQDDSLSKMRHEYQAAEILVARNENPAFLAGATQEDRVRSTGKSNFGSGNYIVTEAAQEANAQRVNALIGQESHATALT